MTDLSTNGGDSERHALQWHTSAPSGVLRSEQRACRSLVGMDVDNDDDDDDDDDGL